MLALARPVLPPPRSLPQRCTEVPNPIQGSLRKFFVRDVFSKNSPQPTFFFTSNVAGFNFSAPAATWIRREGASFEARPHRGRLAGCRELQHTKHQHHRTTRAKSLQHITANASAMEPGLGKSVLPEDILTHAVIQTKKIKQAFNLWWHFQPKMWLQEGYFFLYFLFSYTCYGIGVKHRISS